jgi:hypothetical protein
MQQSLTRLAAVAAFLVAASLYPSPTYANVVFEWNEGGPGNGTNSIHISRHGVGGPVLADDFVPAFSGAVTSITWWGSAPITTATATDSFEVTFHSDAGGVPAGTAPSGGIGQHFVTATGLDPDGDGVFEFTAPWTPQDVNLTAGTTYWFSVANASGNSWTWANPGGASPSVGSETFGAVVSTGVGPNGGPHFGPWNAVSQTAKQDFAFRIDTVPEPSSFALLGLGAVGLVAYRRRKSRRS